MLIGIDLGTTNSLVGVFRDGETALIPNALGHLLTPSAVSVTPDGQILVGLAARERLSSHPLDTAVTFKRWMGTDKKVRLAGQDFRAEELSALVLRALVADAQAYLGQTVTEAVITVPAYFNEVQRKATKTAAELAGLKVERLLNEPTAAGLAYGLQEKPDHTTFLIFDLGGGTFDVSVIEYFEGVVEVRASAGDTRLGGEDFVRVIVKYLLEQAPGLAPTVRDELLENGHLWRVAEQLKRDLSDQEEATAEVRFGATDEALKANVTLTRKEFELRSTELLQRLRRPIERALSDARLLPQQLDEVVLVGGASRMPMVRQMMTRLFQRLPLRVINPDEAIARGAAVQAALKSRDAALDEVVLTDVMPFTLGVVTTRQVGERHIGDCFSPIIERNIPTPVSRMETFTTITDGQQVVKLDIRQGESPVGSDNLHLGVIDIPVPARPAGDVKVEVRFTYDANGMLEVDVKESGKGTQVNKIIHQSGTQLTADQIEQAHKRLAALKIHPRDQQPNQYLIQRAKRLFEDHLGDQREWIAQHLAAFNTVLDTQDERLVREARQHFKQMLDQLDGGFVL